MLMTNGYIADGAPNRRSLLHDDDPSDSSVATALTAPPPPSVDCGWGNHNGCSFIERGAGWYRKHFVIPADWKGQVVSVRFEGVFRTAMACKFLTHP